MKDETLELLARMQAGDQAALERMLDQHLPALRAYVRLNGGGLLRAKEESADIVQSVCREVLGNLERFRYPSPAGFRRWLYATALRKIRDKYDYYVAAKRDARLEDSSGSLDVGELAGLYRTVCTPSREAAAREEVERLEAAFDRLPEHYREVILQARVLGMSRAEIAEESGSTPAAVRVLLSRATAKLAGLMDATDAR